MTWKRIRTTLRFKICTLNSNILAFLVCHQRFFIFLRYSIRMPFDWRTPFGYLTASAVTALTTFQSVSVIVPIVCFTVGSAMLASNLNETVRNDVITFNGFVNESTKVFDEPKKLLCNIIQDFSQGKQFSINHGDAIRCQSIIVSVVFSSRFVAGFNEITIYNITVLFLWSVLTLCSALLALEMELVQYQ